MNEEIKQAEQALVDAQNNLCTYLEGLRSLRHQEFVSKGGCKRCSGWGRVLTWSTLDGSGYDEFGVCPEPTCTASTVGRDVTTREPGTHYRTVDVRTFAQSAQEKQDMADLESLVQTAQDALESVQDKFTPSKGKEIEVIRGSKGAKKGQTGTVFWTREDSYQPYRNGPVTHTLKVGAKDKDGNVFWTTGKSCKVTNTEVKKDKGVLVTAKMKKETAKAYMLTIKGKDVWVPKSQVKKVNDVAWVLTKWIAEQNGLTK